MSEIIETLKTTTLLCKQLHYIHRKNKYHGNLNSKTIQVTNTDVELINEKTPIEIHYAAPELIENSTQAIDHRADLYSVGVFLYHKLTGKLPFAEYNNTKLTYIILKESPVLPHGINKNIPPIISDIILKLLDKNPDSRYQTTKGLKYDLEFCTQNFSVLPALNFFELGLKDYVIKKQQENPLLFEYESVNEELRAANEELKAEIEERRQVENLLEETRNYFRALFNHVADPVFIVNLDSNYIIDANNSTVKNYGYTKEELLKMRPSDIDKSETHKLGKKLLIDDFKGETVFETIHTKKNGETFPVEIHGSRTKYKSQNLILTVARDITERKLTEQALVYSEAKLRNLNETKDKLFSIIGHDLKSPLSNIIGISELLGEYYETEPREKIKYYQELIHQSAISMYELLESLLQWSRVQQKTTEIIPVEINLNSLADNCIKMHETIALNKKIRLINNLPKDDTVFADNNMIITVLRNIIQNAIKFTKPNGFVIINGEKINEKIYKVAVTDTGIGIKPELQDKIFQLDKKYISKGTDNEKGTGLGLLICKDFVEKNGGKLGLNSELGKGSTFYFTLPLKP